MPCLCAFLRFTFLWYTVNRVIGKSRHLDRMSQDQTIYMTEVVSDIGDCEMHPPYWKIPTPSKNSYHIWKFLLNLKTFLLSDIGFFRQCRKIPTMSENSNNVGKFLVPIANKQISAWGIRTSDPSATEPHSYHCATVHCSFNWLFGLYNIKVLNSYSEGDGLRPA